jgi:hypothetical protein
VAREPHHHGGPCLHALFSSQAQPTSYVHNRLSAQQLASSSFTLLPSTRLPIMPYGKTDELAINTIRTLAVCFPFTCCCPATGIATPLSQSFFTSHRADGAERYQLLIRCFAGRCHFHGQLWPPGRPYGHGPGGSRCLEQVHDFQPQEPRLGQPRSFRPLVRIFAIFSNSSFEDCINGWWPTAARDSRSR